MDYLLINAKSSVYIALLNKFTNILGFVKFKPYNFKYSRLGIYLEANRVLSI